MIIMNHDASAASINCNKSDVHFPTVVKEFYTVVKEDGNFIEARCKLCRTKNVIRGQFAATSNFTKHIKVGWFG